MNASPVSAQKYLLRLRMRRTLQRLDAETRRRKSAAILKKLFRLPVYRKARFVFFYMSLPQEVQTKTAVKQTLTAGKKVFVPRIGVSGRRLEVCEIKNPQKDFKKSQFGILEPKGKRLRDLSRLNLIVMPGLAFDNKGNRLGRGLGYFDRFLAKVKGVPKVALAYKEQVIRSVPVEPHDISADKVLTD